jgi:hypothetical protein
VLHRLFSQHRRRSSNGFVQRLRANLLIKSESIPGYNLNIVVALISHRIENEKSIGNSIVDARVSHMTGRAQPLSEFGRCCCRRWTELRARRLCRPRDRRVDVHMDGNEHVARARRHADTSSVPGLVADCSSTSIGLLLLCSSRMELIFCSVNCRCSSDRLCRIIEVMCRALTCDKATLAKFSARRGNDSRRHLIHQREEMPHVSVCFSVNNDEPINLIFARTTTTTTDFRRRST